VRAIDAVNTHRRAVNPHAAYGYVYTLDVLPVLAPLIKNPDDALAKGVRVLVAADFACALASKDEATGSHDHYGDAMTLLAAAPSVTAAPPPPVDPLTNAPVSSRSICARVFPDGKASTSDHARAKIRRASEGLQLCRELGLGGDAAAAAAGGGAFWTPSRAAAAVGEDLRDRFWKWVTCQIVAEENVEAAREDVLEVHARRREKAKSRKEASRMEKTSRETPAAAGTGPRAAASGAAAAADAAEALPAARRHHGDAASPGAEEIAEERLAAPPLALPWRDDAARPFLASQPWSGVVSQFALPGGSARRVGAVEHAGLSFEDALRAAAKARGAELRGTETAAAAAAGAVPLDDDRRRFIAAELDFADATSRANAADVAIRSIARAAFQRIAKALHVDKQRGAADADDTDVSVARAKHARDVLYDPLKRRKYLVLCDDAKWKADERARETRAADAAARRAARGGDGEVDAAGMEREERQFSDFRARAEDERRRELENQERMKQRSASLYESKRATERREATGRGVRAEERGGKVAAQFAKNAEKLRAVKAARDVEEDGSGRAARAHRLHGNKPNPCRTPVLELVGDAFHRVADGGTKKFLKVRVHFFISAGAHAGAPDAFEVEACRGGGGGGGGGDAFARVGRFPGVRNERTFEVEPASHGVVELREGRHAIRVRAVNGAGVGEWSMRSETTLGSGGGDDDDNDDAAAAAAARPVDPVAALARIEREYADAIDRRVRPVNDLAAFVNNITSKGWRPTDEGWANASTGATVAASELAARMKYCHVYTSKTLAAAVKRLSGDLARYVMSEHALGAHDGRARKNGLDADAAQTERRALLKKAMDAERAMRSSVERDAKGHLVNAATLTRAETLELEALDRAELARARRGKIAPYESQMGAWLEASRVVAAAADAEADRVPWPARGPGGGGGAGGGGGGGLVSKIVRVMTGASVDVSSSESGVVWGLPCLVADALFSASAKCSADAHAAAAAFERSATHTNGHSLYANLERAARE